MQQHLLLALLGGRHDQRASDDCVVAEMTLLSECHPVSQQVPVVLDDCWTAGCFWSPIHASDVEPSNSCRSGGLIVIAGGMQKRSIS